MVLIQNINTNNNKEIHRVFRTIEFKMKILNELKKFKGSDYEFALKHKIPKQTLSNWKKNENKIQKTLFKRKSRNVTSNSSTRRFKREEDKLSQKVKERIKQRKLVTTSIIKRMFVEEFEGEKRNEISQFLVKSKNWIYYFMKRYGFSIRRNTTKSSSTFDIENKEKRMEVIEFLSTVKTSIESYDDKAILQMDETALQYEPAPGNTVTITGSKDVNPIDTVNVKQNFTGVVTVNKAGDLLKPMVILPNLKKSPFNREDCLVSVSPTGKMNSDLMKEWYTEVIIPYLDKNSLEKCLLICDQYGSHKTDDVLKFMTRVEVLLLPSTATSLLQPLDVNFFRSLKRKLTDKWVIENYTREGDRRRERPTLTQRRSEAVNSFIHEVISVRKITIIKAFQMCGIYRQNELLITGLNNKLLEVVNWNEN